MGQIYTKGMQQDFTLPEFLTSPGRAGYIEGMRFIHQGTAEWDRFIEDQRNSLAVQEYTEPEISRKIEEFSAQKLIKLKTAFAGMRWPEDFPSPDRVFKNYFRDAKLNLLCNISRQERTADILPARDHRGNFTRELFGGVAKVMQYGIYEYEGTGKEALQELQQAGISLRKAEWGALHDFVSGRCTLERPYLIIKEISLEEL